MGYQVGVDDLVRVLRWFQRAAVGLLFGLGYIAVVTWDLAGKDPVFQNTK